jgi:hypothetical protein
MLRPQRKRKQTFKALQSASNARSVSQIVDSKFAKKREFHAFQPVPAEQVAEPRRWLTPGKSVLLAGGLA